MCFICLLQCSVCAYLFADSVPDADGLYFVPLGTKSENRIRFLDAVPSAC